MSEEYSVTLPAHCLWKSLSYPSGGGDFHFPQIVDHGIHVLNLKMLITKNPKTENILRSKKRGMRKTINNEYQKELNGKSNSDLIAQ